MHRFDGLEEFFRPLGIPGKVVIDKHNVPGADSPDIPQDIFHVPVDIAAFRGAVVAEIAPEGAAPARMDHIAV